MGRRKKYADETEVANQQMEAASGYPVQDVQDPTAAPSLDEQPKDVEDSDRELTKEKFPDPAPDKTAEQPAATASDDSPEVDDEDDEDDELDDDDDGDVSSDDDEDDGGPREGEELTPQPADEQKEATEEVAASVAEPAQPVKRRAKTTEFLRYDFSQDEMTRLSRDLALAVRKREQAQNALKAAQAQFKQQIEAETANIALFANFVSMGYEMRNIDCMVNFHQPEPGRKQIWRMDTGELVREEKMRRDEMQEQLFDEALPDQGAIIQDFFKAA